MHLLIDDKQCYIQIHFRLICTESHIDKVHTVKTFPFRGQHEHNNNL
jgi:hypothetical protein